MKKSDVQLGKPNLLYKGTTAELSALSAVEGMQAYDTTLDKFVYYDGSNWIESAEQIHTHVEADITDLDHTDTDAIHVNGLDEISSIADSSIPNDSDVLLLERQEILDYLDKFILNMVIQRARQQLNQDLTSEAMVDIRANIDLELEDKLIPDQP
jgi:hypothetical protein